MRARRMMSLCAFGYAAYFSSTVILASIPPTAHIDKKHIVIFRFAVKLFNTIAFRCPVFRWLLPLLSLRWRPLSPWCFLTIFDDLNLQTQRTWTLPALRQYMLSRSPSLFLPLALHLLRNAHGLLSSARQFIIYSSIVRFADGSECD